MSIYVEGSGDTKDQKGKLHLGFEKFLSELGEAVTAKGLKWRITLCANRLSAYQDFKLALATDSDWLNILLVDAESSVERTPWKHLNEQDNWQNQGISDDCCHLMAQTVKAWIIADPEALAKYYGSNFRAKSLPRNRNVEDIPKQDLLQGLQRASQDTTKGKYEKIQHCADLLARIDVAKVRSRAPHCERLFTTLLSLI